MRLFAVGRCGERPLAGVRRHGLRRSSPDPATGQPQVGSGMATTRRRRNLPFPPSPSTTGSMPPTWRVPPSSKSTWRASEALVAQGLRGTLAQAEVDGLHRVPGSRPRKSTAPAGRFAIPLPFGDYRQRGKYDPGILSLRFSLAPLPKATKTRDLRLEAQDPTQDL